MCQKIILTHAQLRKKDECDTKLCDMIQDFDEQLKERMTYLKYSYYCQLKYSLVTCYCSETVEEEEEEEEEVFI